jgi:hypothetical protein
MKNHYSPALYERQPGESSPAWQAFCTYRELGPDRGLRAVARKCHKGGSLIGRWSHRWHWVKRLEAWSAHEAELLEAAQRRVAEAKAHEWARREQDLREQEWEHAEQLLAKADQMLRMPIVRQEKRENEGPDGKVEKITIIEPTRWDFGTAARMIELASKLGRMAIGMETDKVKQESVVSAGPVVTEASVVLYLPDNGMRQAGATVTLPMEAPPWQAGGNGAAKAPKQPKGRAGAAK